MRRLPLHVALARWEDYAKADLAPGSREDYGYWLLRFFWQTHTDPYEATVSDLAGFLGSFGERGPSRQMARQALRHFFGWLAGSGYRESNPAAFLPRTRRRRRPAPFYFTEEEIARFIYTAACHNPRWAWEFLFMVGTGARVSEACSLKVSDVDLGAGVCAFRNTKNGSDRVVHLGKWAYASATALVDGQPRLFSVGPPGLRARMVLVGEMARLPRSKCHPHALRHTAGTLLSERGADPRAIMEQLGHTDPQMVAVYVHVTSRRAKQVAALL